METNTFMMPIGGKSILRSTGEEVEIIDFEAKERGDRTDEDWVTYIDSKGSEHIKNVIDDPDAREGVTFARWLATMAVNGIEIEWSDILDHS